HRFFLRDEFEQLILKVHIRIKTRLLNDHARPGCPWFYLPSRFIKALVECEIGKARARAQPLQQRRCFVRSYRKLLWQLVLVVDDQTPRRSYGAKQWIPIRPRPLDLQRKDLPRRIIRAQLDFDHVPDRNRKIGSLRQKNGKDFTEELTIGCFPLKLV